MRQQSPQSVSTDNRADDPAWFRYVLGQYPTGVTLITATHPDGSQLGMVVGTFSSVSLDPPLVAFMPDVRSSSWPKIREAGSFCANILTAGQQDVCRAFARKEEHRFSASNVVGHRLRQPAAGRRGGLGGLHHRGRSPGRRP